MHEVSIILNVLEIAEDHCKEKGYKRIDLIRLRIGKASGVLLDALLFAFEATKKETIAHNASLVIDEVPVSGLCRECGAEFHTNEKYILCCTECGSVDFTLTGGRELDIVELEVS